MRRLQTLSIMIIATLFPLAAIAADPIPLPKTVPFAKGISVPDAVKAECQLPEKTAQFVKEFSEGNMQVSVSDNVSAKTPGKALVMQIVDVHGTGGGAWSGAKMVATEGTLYDNGKVIGSFKATRYSGGGAFGGYKGTCSILGRCTKAIGKDVAEWLKSPSMNAKLGDAK